MTESSIPESWETCALGDVVDYGRTTKAEPAEIPEDAWILELEDIEKDSSKLLSRVTFAERQSKSTKNRFCSGDVLYGKLRPYLNKVIRAEDEGYCSTEIIPLRATSAITSDYLFYWLKSPVFLEYVGEVSHGLNMPRLGTQAGRQAPLVLAPLNEQRRIADKLDAVLARVDACRERLDRVPAILERFRQSILAAATSGKLTEDWREENHVPDTRAQIASIEATQKPRRGVREVADGGDALPFVLGAPAGWARETAASLLLKGLLEDLKDGNHGSNHPLTADFTNEGLPFITAAQVGEFSVDYDGAQKISGKPLAKLRVGFAKADDVVLTHKGSVGRVACIDRDCMLTPQTTYYRTNPSFLLPRYLMYYMASEPFSRQLDDIKSQTTRDFVPISKQYGLWHLLPSVVEQEEIVRRIDVLFDFASRIGKRHAVTRQRAELLTPALLATAFRGELVSQDPSDEPASELLERIRAARADQSKRKPSRKARGTPAPKASRKGAAMTKSRQDEDVKGMPYLAAILRETADGMDAEDLFRYADLSLADFYKQLAWEVANGHIRDDESRLEVA